MASSCTALSSLASADGERSATSSRNSVPWSTASNLPRRARTPVAMRSSMPNSSASSNVSTNAAQLTATNGPRWRSLRSCTCRATSSLPDPLSPSINTVKSVAATRSICPRRRCMQALAPMSGAAPSTWRPSVPSAASRLDSSISPRTRAASRNDCRSQPSNPYDGSRSTSRCNPGRAGVGTGNRSTPAVRPSGSGRAPTGPIISRAARIGTRARTAATRLSSGLADAPVSCGARAARKTENRWRRSRRRPRGLGVDVDRSGVDVDEEKWLDMGGSVARTVRELLVLHIKRNAIGRSP